MLNEITASSNYGADIHIECSWLSKQECIYELTVSMCEEDSRSKENPCLLFEWNIPVLDVSGIWHPKCGFDRSLKADWWDEIKTMTSISAPVVSLFGEAGGNRMTFALSEVKKEVWIKAGVHEEDGTISLNVRIPVKNFQKTQSYSLHIYINTENIPYYSVLNKVVKWWELEEELIPAKVPISARMPMYSTWYTFHQRVSHALIEEECNRAKELGFETVILDDGWQTEDCSRDYGYCGDWQVAEKKFSSMKRHVKTVHDMGMKYMVWFSVPFIGKFSDHWKAMSDKLLCYMDKHKAGVLDLRYKEVRTYLETIYIHAVEEWDIDGIKLDFIDEFFIRQDTPAYNEKMDFLCIQDALDCFLTEVVNKLKQIKPDIMIEFRQGYIGPNMRKFGNIFRVGDCPASALSNRVGIIDLRLLSGITAVHSDMLMWHEEEKVETAARQLISSIFGVLQLSVNLERQSEEMKKMLRFYIQFAKENMELLQLGTIEAIEPQNLYPVAKATDGKSCIIALFSGDRIVEVEEEMQEITIINGSEKEMVTLYFQQGQAYHICQMDCQGNIMYHMDKEIRAGYGDFSVTVSGMLKVKRVK
ncbi:alpha-galactosidase [Lachnospiraceae bacterium OttesenSCG-928-D06]|nr:alpha-galactosidase [Lachnospiraceae bacterium OttesenSCG-928-D06]